MTTNTTPTTTFVRVTYHSAALNEEVFQDVNFDSVSWTSEGPKTFLTFDALVQGVRTSVHIDMDAIVRYDQYTAPVPATT